MKGYKTLLFNGIIFLTGLAEMSGMVLPESFASDVNGAALALIGVVGVALRAVTNSPIGK